MELRFALIADAANISQEGKLNVLGEFNAVFAPVAPTNLPPSVAVFKVASSEADPSTLNLVISVVQEDEQLVLGPWTAQITKQTTSNGLMPEYGLVVPLTGLSIPAYGSYSICLSHEAERLARVALHVLPRPNG